MRKSIVSIGCVTVLLGGCAVGPDYKPPPANVPQTWSELQRDGNVETSEVSERTVSIADWWKTFGDATLDSLVARAVSANLDVRRAEARIREARALRGVASGQLLPGVDATGSYTRNRSSENVPLPGAGRESNLYQVGFDASWEVDVFGGIRRSVEAADAAVEASIEARRDVLISLVAEVARNYLELRGFQAQLAIARENLTAQEKTLELTRARLQVGRVPELDVARAEAQVATTTSRVPVIETLAAQSVHRLSVLLGREPGALGEELSQAKPIPPVPPQIPVGLPSDLLRRRPDLRRAERELAAATARIGVATAELYPRFSLTGAFNLESVSTSDYANWGSRAWSAGPSVFWPIFHGGSILAKIQVESARQEEAAVAYEQAILTALRDVEDALIASAKERLHRKSLSDAVAANLRAVDLANQRYTQGLVDFLSVLDAERSLYASQDALVESERSMSVSVVALYKAIGGGWREES